MSTSATTSPGFDSRRNVSKYGPVAPSAKSQRVSGVGLPMATAPAANG